MKKLAWVHYPISPDGGATRGYLNFAFSLWNALRNRMGRDLIDAGTNGDHPRMSLHACPPHFFRPIKGKFNVLFTMWEGDTLPNEVVRQLSRADRLLVPSEYCRQVWRAHGLAAEVIPLGVHDAWLNADTSRPLIRHEDSVMRFLWVGSAVSRKGWELLAPAWREAFGNVLRGGAQLYVKTIAQPGLPQKVEEAYGGRVTIDSRDLDTVDLLRLYQSAEVFLFPSYGEGFGLPVLEAMAAGCLAVSTDVGGLSEVVNPVSAIVIPRNRNVVIDYGGTPYEGRVPDVRDVATAMRLAYDHWGTPKVEDRRAYGIRMARELTWTKATERLIEILALAAPSGTATEPTHNAPHSNVVRFPGRP